MAPAGQYVFAEMLGILEHFTAGSHEWLPYSVIPTFPKLICKQQFVLLFLTQYTHTAPFHLILLDSKEDKPYGWLFRGDYPQKLHL